MRRITDFLKNFVLLLMCAVCVSLAGVLYLNQKAVASDYDVQPLYVRVWAITEGDFGKFIFTRDSLEECFDTFSDDPVIQAHDDGNPNGKIGHIMSCKYIYDKEADLGHIELIIKIIVKDAIEKIQRERYKCMSVGVNVTEGNRINPGQIVIGKFIGKEISFVAVPADDNARVIEFSRDLEEVLE